MDTKSSDATAPKAGPIADAPIKAAVPFMHTFPGSPVRPSYLGLAVRHGLNVYPVVSFDGRDCYVTGSQRINRKAGWGFFNSLTVNFLDGTTQQIPAGEFSKKARAALAKATGAA